MATSQGVAWVEFFCLWEWRVRGIWVEGHRSKPSVSCRLFYMIAGNGKVFFRARYSGDSRSHHPVKFSHYQWGQVGTPGITQGFSGCHWRCGRGSHTHFLPLQCQTGKGWSTFFLSNSHQRLEIKTFNCVLGFSSGTWLIISLRRKQHGHFLYLTPSL